MKRKWSVGTYVVFNRSYGGSHKGYVDVITQEPSANGYIWLFQEGHAKSETDYIHWFETRDEANAYSKSLLNEEFVFEEGEIYHVRFPENTDGIIFKYTSGFPITPVLRLNVLDGAKGVTQICTGNLKFTYRKATTNEKQLLMKENQQYQMKAECTKFTQAARSVSSGYDGCTFSYDSMFYNEFKNAGILDAWFEIAPEVKLPTIGSYEGEIHGNGVKYGCQEYSILNVRNLIEIMEKNNISSIKCNMSVGEYTITLQNLKTVLTVLSK